MIPIFPAPIMLADFLSQTSASVCSAFVVSFTALVYLAMIWSSFWRDAETKPSETEQSKGTFHTGGEK